MTQREILSVRAPLLAFALAGLFAGCQSTGPTASSLSASATAFSASDAAFIKKSGTGKIAGHAFWRDGKGGVVNAAGEIVRLVPATAYAKERFATLYKGGRSVPVNMVAQVDSDPAYAEYTRTTRAESSGRFEFEGVAPGTYFVATQIAWKDKDSYLHFKFGAYNNVQRVGQDGGAFYETVTVTGKEDKPIKLVLTNDR